MRCTICKKTSDEIKLYTGISGTDMVMICEGCAKIEGVPLIQKPSVSQLDKADKRYSVRERMERMSGMHDYSDISEDQISTQGNLAKLRVLPKKEYNENVVDNYYWTLNIARRRAKLSIKQLSEQVQISPNLIQSIEKGKIPDDFEEVFAKLEIFLKIKLLKSHKNKISFTQTIEEEDRILRDVNKKIENSKNMRTHKIPIEKIDLHKRKDLSDVTLDDLVEMKKKRETQRQREIKMMRKSSMIGDDLDLDIEEL